MFVEIVAEKKNVHKSVECCPIHQRSNFAPNTSLHVQAMKDSCSRSKQSLFFVLISWICIITKALTFAAFQPEVPTMDHHYPRSTVLEVTRVQMFQQRILPLSLALGCTPASGRVQTWLFSNIIRKEIALLFFFANGLQPCVSCIPSRTHYAQQEKERKKNRMWAMDEHIGQ